jgi:hypothetical protein
MDRLYHDPKNGPLSDFCKTNGKPYDLAVTLVLLIIKRHAPHHIHITSDGRWEREWLNARAAFLELFSVDATGLER